ncbi:MAG: 4Fe-4S binding protein [Candidatus Thorarchaeota archaeon]|nr:4Fe-4S binding protein [Candidatus Thorarchaeota archaeon]
MAEDAERLEETGEEEELPESVETVEKPDISEKKERKPRSNPLGMIFNLRMLRRVVQIVFLLGINAYIFTAWFGAEYITAFWTSIRDIFPSIPILSPLEAPFAVISGSFDTMQRTFTSGFFPFFTIGSMIIILIFVGRAPCGWICPLGTIQDFVTLPKRTKVRPAPGTEIELRKFKFYIFVITAGLAVWLGVSVTMGSEATLEAILGIFATDAFAPLNPAYILFKILPDLQSAGLWPTSIGTLWYITQWGFALLQLAFVIFVFFLSIWVPRWFCRWLCPAGWLYSVFSREALIGIGRNPARCTPDTCNVCEVVCPMNIRIRKYPYQHMHSPDCIMCLDCKSHCPNDAIIIRFS